MQIFYYYLLFFFRIGHKGVALGGWVLAGLGARQQCCLLSSKLLVRFLLRAAALRLWLALSPNYGNKLLAAGYKMRVHVCSHYGTLYNVGNSGEQAGAKCEYTGEHGNT